MKRMISAIFGLCLLLIVPASLFSETRFERLRLLKEKEVKKEISIADYEKEKSIIFASFFADAKRGEEEYLSGIHAEKLTKLAKIPISEKISSYTCDLIPHDFHKYNLISKDGSFSRKRITFIARKFLKEFLGPDNARKVSFDEEKRIYVSEMCPKSNVSKEPKGFVYLLPCKLSFDLAPNREFSFRLFISERGVVLPIYEIPNLKRNVLKEKIFSFYQTAEFLFKSVGIDNSSLQSISFSYHKENDCFVWNFFTEPPKYYYDDKSRIYKVRADKLEILSVDEIWLSHNL